MVGEIIIINNNITFIAPNIHTYKEMFNGTVESCAMQCDCGRQEFGHVVCHAANVKLQPLRTTGLNQSEALLEGCLILARVNLNI